MWVSQLVEECGHEEIVAQARELRKIHQSDCKTDRSDAEHLARLAAYDPQLMAPIRHRSAEAQADLAMIRARDGLVGARTKLVNMVRGLVKSSGPRLPSCSAESFQRRVESSLPRELQLALKRVVAAIGALTEQIGDYDRDVQCNVCRGTSIRRRKH